MKYNSEMHHRKSVRLKKYDYSEPGAFFVTICTHNRECRFGNIINENLRYSKIGTIAEEILTEKVNSIGLMRLDSYVIMPNHLHMIIFIEDSNIHPMGVSRNVPTKNKKILPHRNCVVNNTQSKSHSRRGVIHNAQNRQYYSYISPKGNSLSIPVRKYKAAVTRWCNNNGYKFFKWQRNYYEHIIRNEIELNQIREYIINNPLKWDLDKENPKNLGNKK